MDKQRIAIITAIGLLIFLVSSNIFIIGFLYLLSLVFMLKIGSGMMLDVDPSPFVSFLVQYLYDPVTAAIYVILTILSIDIISGRFNMFSAVNLVSALITIAIFIILPVNILYGGILVFNLLRIGITLFLGLGPQTILFSTTHAVIYFLAGSVASFFL